MAILIVNKKDQMISKEEKLKTHLQGKRHRAFSIFVFDKDKRLLLQKRAVTKYHSMGLWSNACCSHPSKDKNIKQQAEQRLKQEMGFSCPLQEKFVLPYKAKVKSQNGYLIENEVDHVFVGIYNGAIKPNPDETDGYQWLTLTETRKQIKQNPNQFTYWFKKIINNKQLCLTLIKNKK